MHGWWFFWDLGSIAGILAWLTLLISGVLRRR